MANRNATSHAMNGAKHWQFPMVNRITFKVLTTLLLVYFAASLVHFIHNAEFLADYPNMPSAWTRQSVYLAWGVMTTVGIAGWTLAYRGYQRVGLLLLVLYALLGLDSLGHYVLAPLSSHSAIMNLTILFEVTTAALVLGEVLRQFRVATRPAT